MKWWPFLHAKLCQIQRDYMTSFDSRGLLPRYNVIIWRHLIREVCYQDVRCFIMGGTCDKRLTTQIYNSKVVRICPSLAVCPWWYDAWQHFRTRPCLIRIAGGGVLQAGNKYNFICFDEYPWPKFSGCIWWKMIVGIQPLRSTFLSFASPIDKHWYKYLY